MRCPACSAAAGESSSRCPHCGAPLPVSEVTTLAGDASEAADPSPLALEFAPGSDFGGRYTIIEKTAEGGMGLVYKAVDRSLDQTVALKLIRPSLSAIPAVVRHFKSEVRLARQISHPYVCRVHDLGEVRGVLFLSMEWIDGETLRRLMT